MMPTVSVRTHSSDLRLMSAFIISLMVVFLQFFSAESKAQSENYQWLSRKNLQSMPLDTVLVKLSGVISDMNGKNDKDIKQALFATLARAKATNNPVYMAKANQHMANWHYGSISSENKDSIYHYDYQSLTYYLKTNEKELTTRAYRTVGLDLDAMQKYAEAEKYYFKSLRLAQSFDFESGINAAHAALAALYSGTKDYNLAIKYSKLVIEAYKKDKNIHPLIRALNTLSDIYVNIGQPEKALTACNEALALTADLPESRRQAEILNVRAWRGKAYRALKRYDEALQDFVFSWKGMQKMNGSEGADGWKGDIGGVYHLQGKHTEAIPYLRDYINHLKGKKVYSSEELKKHNLWLAESLKALNQTDLAYKYLSDGKEIEINTLQQETEALKNELRVKYETEQKDQTIASQSGQIEQQRKIQMLSYALGGLLVLILGGLYFTYRNNKKKNLKLQELNQNLETSNAQLDKRNAENELLLKEIHHRVKNNLEVVSSLLALQSAKIDDPEVQDAMLASQNRVQSMGILHQKLYQSEHLAFIEMKTYFKNLCENILDSYNETDRIKVDIDMKEIEMDVDTAMPVGLIVNELLTNSLKYAFPDGKKGEIKLALENTQEDMYQLTVKDNGIGKQASESGKGTGFGTQLVDLLTRQIDGVFKESNESGTVISIAFKLQKAA